MVKYYYFISIFYKYSIKIDVYKRQPFDCVFCNQKKITGTRGNVDEKEVRSIIEEHLKKLPKEDCEIEIAFFGGSFTGIEDNLQERLLSCAFEYVGKSNITGIRVSTRPDYINDSVIKRLIRYNATTVELGVQSLSLIHIFQAPLQKFQTRI